MKKLIFVLLLTALASPRFYAQFGSSGSVDARAMSMARTYNAVSNGVASLGINPANLMYKADGSVDFITVLPLPQISLGTGTDFISVNDFNYFFGGENGSSRILTDADKDRFYNLFDNGGLVFANLSTRFLSISYKEDAQIGAFAFSINDNFGAKAVLPQALVDLAMNGNAQGKAFSLDQTDLKSWWIRNYSLTYARQISEFQQDFFDQINAGVTLKLVHGFMYAGTEYFNTQIATGSGNALTGTADMLAYSAFSPDLGVEYDFDSVTTDKKASPFLTPAGTGFGLDFGVSAVYDKVFTFSLAVTDIGSISWDKHAAEFTSLGAIYFDDLTDESQRDSLSEKFKGKGQPIAGFSTGLPTVFRAGASYLINDGSVPGTLLLALDYNQGFNNLPGNSTNPRVSVGAEWKPMDYIPYIRTGISVGGLNGFNWGFGIGFDTGIVEFDLATSDAQTFAAPNSARHLSVAFGSRWKF